MYTTAREFAEAKKRELYQFFSEPEDLERRRQAVEKTYAEQISGSSFNTRKEFNEVNTMFQDVVDLIIKDFFEILPPQTKADFKKHFYFSTVDNLKITANIWRSPNDKKLFAVFINSALINLLTKLGKLDMALKNPDCVVFCSRFPESRPSLSDIKEMRNEMYEYYAKEKMPHGPFLIINGYEAEFHFNKLDIQEKLIIFHEIGHFLSGDLSENRFNQELNSNFPNIHHQREYIADLIGFGLLLKLEKRNNSLTRERRLFLLSAVINLFDVMHGLQKEESGKYPHPLNRMNNIIEYYYGIKIADIVEKTYSDKEEWKYLHPDICPPIESNEEIMDVAINNAFVSVFNELDEAGN